MILSEEALRNIITLHTHSAEKMCTYYCSRLLIQFSKNSIHRQLYSVLNRFKFYIHSDEYILI